MVAEDDPRPPEAACDAQRTKRIVGRAPRQRRVDVRPLGARERQVLGLAGAAHAGCRLPRRDRVPGGVRFEPPLPLVPHLLEREGADAVEQPVAVAVDDDE